MNDFKTLSEHALKHVFGYIFDKPGIPTAAHVLKKLEVVMLQLSAAAAAACCCCCCSPLLMI